MRTGYQALLLSILLGYVSASLAASLCVKWPSTVFQPTPNPTTHAVAPDYGIYWFHRVNGHEKVMKAFTPPSLAPQQANGTLNTLPKDTTLAQAKAAYLKKLEAAGFFDPKKPTLLFIHGDQPTFIGKRKRIDFCYSYKKHNGESFPLLNTALLWKNWNIGIFYWTAFADDVTGKGIKAFIKAVTYPEMKIYSSHNPAGMRWAYLNSHGQTAFCQPGQKGCANLPTDNTGDVFSVRELAYYAYANAFPKDYHQNIRITGQSLGTQLAIQLAGLVADHPQLPQPTELILLDPYFTPSIHSIHVGNGQEMSVAKYNYLVAEALLKRDPQLGFAIYRSTTLSEWPFGTRNQHLEHLAAYLRICPSYLNNAAKKQRTLYEHLSCAYIYFHSKKFPVPTNYVNASSSPADIRKLMGTKRYCKIDAFHTGCGKTALTSPIHCPIERAAWRKVY